MKSLIFISFCLFLLSCQKEKVGNTNSVIRNSTNFVIKLLPYKNGILDNSNLKELPPNTDLVVYTANVRGKTLEPCFGTLLQPYDSILVTFNDSIKIPHIKFNLPYSGTHKILFNSNRSISNQNNWTQNIESEDKYSIRGRFTFTFVYQDYLDAR
jgi:hypothetical protein